MVNPRDIAGNAEEEEEVDYVLSMGVIASFICRCYVSVFSTSNFLSRSTPEIHQHVAGTLSRSVPEIHQHVAGTLSRSVPEIHQHVAGTLSRSVPEIH